MAAERKKETTVILSSYSQCTVDCWRSRLQSRLTVRAGSPAVHSRDPSKQFSSATTLGVHVMSGGCAAACGAVWMAPAVMLSRYNVLMLLSGRKMHDVQKRRLHSRNHTRRQHYTQQGGQGAVLIGDNGCAWCERRLSCCLGMCGWLPSCYCCTCDLPLLLPVTPDSVCCGVHNFC